MSCKVLEIYLMDACLSRFNKINVSYSSEAHGRWPCKIVGLVFDRHKHVPTLVVAVAYMPGYMRIAMRDVR